ncbi:hypothetical protein Nepgr_023400 [Nepenthes gracilis]|uniref:Uncharacterized protein n=1 Tax=Nepenthes gracilis TaxID=150966 RepID=A0AAD3T0N4_NEPGR|nr:hypothetical protein Nepgr_023400 [Nepenthes gracilis]
MDQKPCCSTAILLRNISGETELREWSNDCRSKSILWRSMASSARQGVFQISCCKIVVDLSVTFRSHRSVTAPFGKMYPISDLPILGGDIGFFVEVFLWSNS